MLVYNKKIIIRKISMIIKLKSYPRVAIIFVFLLLKSICINTLSFLILVNSIFSTASSPYSSSPSSPYPGIDRIPSRIIWWVIPPLGPGKVSKSLPSAPSSSFAKYYGSISTLIILYLLNFYCKKYIYKRCNRILFLF